MQRLRQRGPHHDLHLGTSLGDVCGLRSHRVLRDGEIVGHGARSDSRLTG